MRSPTPRTSLLTAALLLAALPGLAAAARPAAEAAKGGSRNLVVQPAGAPAVQARRLALVVGNGAYADAPLANPARDARAMARALEAAGFRVLLHVDADQRALLGALREFGQQLRGGGTGLFYFAGHGMQIKGRNYLIPVGADIRREDEVAYQSLDVQAVLDKMESAGNGTNLVILDACRNNPFARSFRSSSQGLAPVDAPVGTLVAFATSPGAVASDGQGDNGLYTRHLLAALSEPGRKVEEVFKQVRTAVRRDSQGQQIPWESTSLEGDFYFHPPVPVAQPAPPPPPDPLAALDDALWETVREAGQTPELQAYLRRFPQGRHADAARARIAALSAAVAAAPAPAPVPVPAPQPARLPPPQPTPSPVADPTGLPPPTPRPGAADVADAIAAVHAALGPAPAAYAPLAPPPGAEPEGPAAQTASAASTRVNRHGFAVGDLYHYRVRDRLRNEVSSVSSWTIDGFDGEDDLLVNGGTLRFDAFGRLVHRQAAGFGSETWSRALQVAWPGMDVGDEREIDTERTRIDPEGRRAVGRFTGRARVVARERVNVPAGVFDTLKVVVRTRGDHQRSDGARYSVYWDQTYWWAPAIGLYVAMESDERVDGRLEARWRRELMHHIVQRESARLAGVAQ